MSDRLFVGLSGLATDIQTLEQLLRFRLNLYKLREERDIKPETFSALLSHILYEKRFGPYFVEPLVAGLKDDNTPFISGMDLIGAPVFAKDFVVAGTCGANLYGLCESFFKPDLEPDQLFEVLSQSLLASVDRDALSGWGAVVHIMYVYGGKASSIHVIVPCLTPLLPPPPTHTVPQRVSPRGRSRPDKIRLGQFVLFLFLHVCTHRTRGEEKGGREGVRGMWEGVDKGTYTWLAFPPAVAPV